MAISDWLINKGENIASVFQPKPTTFHHILQNFSLNIFRQFFNKFLWIIDTCTDALIFYDLCKQLFILFVFIGYDLNVAITRAIEYLVIVYLAKYEKYEKCSNILCVVFDAVTWVVINSWWGW